MADSTHVFGSIRIKLLVLAVVPTMLAVLVVGGVLAQCQTASLTRSLSEKTAHYGELASVQLRGSIAANDGDLARETLNGLVRDLDVVSIRLYNLSREELHSYGPPITVRPVVGGAPVLAHGAFVVAMPVHVTGSPRGTVVLAVSASSLAAERERVVHITIAVAIVAALFAFAIAFPIARRMSRRIQNVSRYATRIAAGDLATEPLDERGSDEVAQTGAAVNTMVAQLQQLMAQQAELAADEKRLVLEHVNQGLFAVTYDGVLVGERSRATETLLGPIADGENLIEIARRHDPRTAATFELGFVQLASDTLPVEIAVFQLPAELQARGRSLSLGYTPFSDVHGHASLLVTVTDITQEREHALAREIEEESAAFFRQLASDRHGVRRFLEEARVQIDLIGAAKSTSVVFDALHTLKGNAGLMGLEGWVKRCHDAETLLAENSELTPDQRQELVWAWSATEDRILPFVRDLSTIEVSMADFDALLHLASSEASWGELRRLLGEAKLESTAMPLRKLADHVRELASRHDRRLGRLVVEDHGVRLEPARWGALWSALTHVVRNVVVHGMREDGATNVTLRTTRQTDGVTIEISDDGRGVQWEALRERARTAGLPCESREDLVAAMFASQITTRDVVDETAGRGVGLAAVAATCRELGVAVELPVLPRGTAFRFHLPSTTPLDQKQTGTN